jgi:hypothetical protein
MLSMLSCSKPATPRGSTNVGVSMGVLRKLRKQARTLELVEGSVLRPWTRTRAPRARS